MSSFFPCLSTYAIEKDIHLFFSANQLLIEKNKKLEPIPKHLKLKNYYTSFSIQSREEICAELFDLIDGYLVIKSPGDKLITYTECKLLLHNNIQKISDKYNIKINRTFTSWCILKEKSTPQIKNTINAILQVTEVKDCNDLVLKQSLFNTKMLNLGGRKITDLSPLGGLINLRALWLENNEISNISPLSSLQNLIVLSLSNNLISDIHSISNFKELQWLFLSSNKIKNIEYFFNLDKIKLLAIKNNLIVNPTPLFHFRSNTLILVQGNPFLKDVCYQRSSVNSVSYLRKQNWLLKVCNQEERFKSDGLYNSASLIRNK